MPFIVWHERRPNGRYALRLDDDGACEVVVTGTHGDVWTHQWAVDIEHATAVIKAVDEFWDALPDGDGDGSIGIGLGRGEVPEVVRLDPDDLPPQAAAWVAERRAETDEVVSAAGQQWSVETVSDLPKVGPSAGGLLGWTAAFVAMFYGGFGLPLMLVSVSLRALLAGRVSPNLLWVVAASPILVAIGFYFLGKRFGRSYPEHRNPTLPAAVPVLLALGWFGTVGAWNGLATGMLFFLYTLLAYIGARRA